MSQPTNPYADPQTAADSAAVRARWASLSSQERFAFLVEIGIYTADGQLHPNYDHRPESEGASRAEAK
jgi:hypothetical protein